MKIIKRNGSEAAFDISKIIVAITKANNADEQHKELTSEQILDIAASVEASCLVASGVAVFRMYVNPLAMSSMIRQPRQQRHHSYETCTSGGCLKHSILL